ncbi:SOS response-associated peptidase [Pseudomonas sp. SDO55104_S430]
MCGRYSIYESMDYYLKELATKQPVINGYDLWPIERYNVAPTHRVEIIRPVEGGLSVDKVKWGWSPAWAKANPVLPILARVETMASNRFFKDLWPQGRALVPANGWFEWVEDPSDPKRKQPYYFTLKDQTPMFYAGLAQVRPASEPDDGDGFVVITTASDGRMLDIHERRPVVLAPEQAREWLDQTTSPQRAWDIAQQHCRPVQDFDWYKVAKAVSNVRNEGREMLDAVCEQSNRTGQMDLDF